MIFSKVERLLLINQYKMLEKLEPDEAEYYQTQIKILSWGYTRHYTDSGLGRKKKDLNIHAVTCDESWEETDREGNVAEKAGRHAWISNAPLSGKNIHERCNLMARKRWLHENNI